MCIEYNSATNLDTLGHPIPFLTWTDTHYEADGKEDA
jgi:hypothetical protein